MRGQGVIGRGCAWCGLPAVCEVEVRRAEYRTASWVDPISGERTSHQRLVRSAIVVPACDEHKHVTQVAPRPVGTPRQCRAVDVEQLGLFVTPEEARLRNAIHGEVGR